MDGLNGFTRKELMTVIWEKPTLAQLELTRNCNQQCCFCFQGSCSTKEYEDMSFESWKVIIDKLKILGVRKINFSGGEVLLHKEFEKIMKYTYEQGFLIYLNTNGQVDISSIVSFCSKIYISLHGTKEIHNKIVNNKDSFDKIIECIKVVNKYKIPLEINMTLIKSNFYNIVELYTYLTTNYEIEKFSPTIAIQTNTGSCIPENEKLVINEQLYKEYFEMINVIDADKLDLKQGMHGFYYNQLEKYCDTTICDTTNCIGGKTKLVINYKGDVYPCNFYQIDEFWCGNLLVDDVKDVWKNGKGFIIFRNMVFNNTIPQKCNDCVKYYKCFSGCRAWTKEFLNGFEKNNGKDGFVNSVDIRCEFTHAFIGNRNYNNV